MSGSANAGDNPRNLTMGPGDDGEFSEGTPETVPNQYNSRTVLKKSVEQTEEELLHLAEVIEATQVSTSEKEEKINFLERELRRKIMEYDDKQMELNNNIRNLKIQKEEFNEVIF